MISHENENGTTEEKLRGSLLVCHGVFLEPRLLGGSCLSVSIFSSWRRMSKWRIKKPLPVGKRFLQCIRIAFYSCIPTRSSFDTAYRKRLFASATLCKPLFRERLLHPKMLLWKQSGSGIYVSREPHLPRILNHFIMASVFLGCQPLLRESSVYCHGILIPFSPMLARRFRIKTPMNAHHSFPTVSKSMEVSLGPILETTCAAAYEAILPVL